MNPNLTLYVSSSDKFADCWDPFFKLLRKFWPEWNGPIIFATETIPFSYPGLDIICPCVQKNNPKKLSWSEITLQTLSYVKTTHILLLLEDYFIKAPVNHNEFTAIFELVLKENYSHLMLIGMPGNNISTKYPFLLERAQNAPYRFSTQAGIWKTDRFKFYLRPHESPWMAEKWGSKRASKTKDSFYSINPDHIKKYGYIIDYYIRGGITKGKWVDSIPDFFQSQGITSIDYSKRGFYSEPPIPPIHKRIRNKLNRLPSEVKSWLSLIC